ncbi:MAG: hypothetical protein ABSF49_06280 [Roseiarcus sp.]|jgi:hypothetical protein|uniref:hypothetical protein n=1 Tax=Roseiarcus sp. TaxID=1969460 RepID=UPI003C1C3010
MKLDRFFRLADAPGTGVSCNQNGLFVGETALLEERRDHLGHPEWHARSLADLSRDLSKRYALPIDFSAKMPAVGAIARALGRGDLVQPQIATLLLQIPDPPKLSKADPTSGELTALMRQLRESGLLKADWDPAKHPRWPAKSPDSVGGRFAPSDSSVAASGTGASSVQAQITIPAPPIEMPIPIPHPLPSEIIPPLIAPNILPRSLPQNRYPSRPECEKEWQEATKYCLKLRDRGQLGRGDYRGMGKTLRDCIMGQVSESCGGNATIA